MALDVVFLVKDTERSMSRFEYHKRKYPFAKKLVSEQFDVDTVKRAAKLSLSSCFYVVKDETIVDDFDFSYKPEESEQQFVHSWPYRKNEGRQVFSPDLDDSYGVFCFSKTVVKGSEGVDPARLGNGITRHEESVGRRAPLDIIVVSHDEPELMANQLKFEADIGMKLKRVDHTDPDEALRISAKISDTNPFYVVDISSTPIGFEFDFFPELYDEKYVHIWKNSDTTYGGVSLYTKEHCTGELKYQAKYIPIQACEFEEHKFDIVFISYDEPNAETNWAALSKRFPRAKRIHGIKGLVAAHRKAAGLGSTQSFFVVDGDTEILESFDFNVDIPDYDRKYVHIWKCRNPVNGLEYGYGGVKLMHKSMFTGVDGKIIDMTTVLGQGVKVIDECVSITHFDSDTFRAFRGTFRECVKLSSGSIKNQDCDETRERLETWTTKAEGKFAEVVLFASRLGKEYGAKHANDPEALSKINKYDWIYTYYRETYLAFKESKLIGEKYNKLDMQTIINLTNLLYSEETMLPLEQIRDALSSGQISSKLWLIDELNNLDIKASEFEVLIVGGWIGLLSNFIFQFYKDPEKIKRIISVDLDKRCELIADRLNLQNHMAEWRFKAATADMMEIDYLNPNFWIESANTSIHSRYDILINTSAEHINNISEWAELIPKDKLVIVQCNNYSDCEGHISCVNSESELVDQLKLSKVLYQGTLPCGHYDRFMAIGIK
jgi:predicted nucleotidyltransferase